MAETNAAPSPDSAPESSSRRRKINELTLQEIEAKIAECRDKQGGLTSKYARQLLLRKSVLSG
jgi:hypothetical protein